MRVADSGEQQWIGILVDLLLQTLDGQCGIIAIDERADFRVFDQLTRLLLAIENPHLEWQGEGLPEFLF